MENAQSETPGTRGTEGCGDQYSDHGNRQEGAGDDGGELGDLAIRNAGTSWQGASLAGGILARLIEDAQSRLDEARECIAWYQREEAKQLDRLKDLEALKLLEDGSG